MEAFEHHLVYEVNMLRSTFNFLHTPAWSPELRNAIIEAFCIHARNLIKFFDDAGQSNYVSAKHFCNNYKPWANGRPPSGDLRGRLNNQIAHLTYDRTARNEDKVGDNEQSELIALIEREIEIFRNSLKEPYKAKWPFNEASAQSAVTNLSTTNHTTSISPVPMITWGA
jgi:hypothetical protein